MVKTALDQTIFSPKTTHVTCTNCDYQIYYNRYERRWLHVHSRSHVCHFRARPHCNYDREIASLQEAP